MLSAADHAVVARDQDIPGLAVVLDPEAVLALLTAGADGVAFIMGARATYVRYKPATSCVVSYELATPTGPVLAYAKAHTPAAAVKLQKARTREVRDERYGLGVITDDDNGVLVAVATSDRDLPALRTMADPARRETLMRRLIPTHPDLWGQQPRTLRHKPERRWLGVIERGAQPIALIKAYREPDFEHARTRQQMLATDGGRLLGWSPRRAVMASRWIEGTSLADLLAAGAPTEMESVGAALARLHATATAATLTANGSRTARALVPAAEAIAALLPGSAALAWRLVDRVAPALLAGHEQQRVVHGDFSADQVVIADRGAHIIDFDQAHVDDPAVDLASFHAELTRAELEGRLGDRRAAAIFAELYEVYERSGGPPIRDRLAAYQAGALLRLAVAPFRQRHPDWPALSDALLRSAGRCLASPPTTAARPR